MNLGLSKDMYVDDLRAGATASAGDPVVVKESPATAYVDGNNLLGPVVGNFCMKLAIEKAKNVGIGIVVAKRSNHYGIAGYYSMQALEHKMIVKRLFTSHANQREFVDCGCIA